MVLIGRKDGLYILQMGKKKVKMSEETFRDLAYSMLDLIPMDEDEGPDFVQLKKSDLMH